MLISLVLMVAGALLLLSNLEIDVGISFKKIWPFCLMILGPIGFIEKLVGRRSFCARSYLVLFTIGIIFFLYYNYSINFWKSWPILLIAVGFAGIERKLTRKISSKADVGCD